MKAAAQIFLSYARADKEKVEKLYQKLFDEGFKSWMDTGPLPGGREAPGPGCEWGQGYG